jgi:very-short-patch-repair endonuclease
MTRPLPRELRELAKDQHGIITRAQAIAAGLSPDTIKRRLASGTWRRAGRGVYSIYSGKSTRDGDLWTAVKRAGDGAVLSHETAAEVHGFADPTWRIRQIHISVPAGRTADKRHKIRGVTIHRRRDLVPDQQPEWRLPRTTAVDTVLDLVETARTFDDAYGWICRAIGRGSTHVDNLRTALDRRKRIRWRAWLTEALSDAEEGVDSPLERRYARGVERAHGLPKAERQARRRVGSGNTYVDNLYEAYRLCVEVDGAATHPDEGRWKDTRRDNANIAADGTSTMRFGWVAVTEERCDSAQLVADALRRNGWTGTIRPCSPTCPIAHGTRAART